MKCHIALCSDGRAKKMKCLTCVQYLIMALLSGERMMSRIILTSFLCILIVMPFRVNAFFWGHAWIKKIPPQERSMGALSHSIAIDAADQPLIMYDEVVPRSIMNVHSQTTTGINCASLADRMVNWHDNQG